MENDDLTVLTTGELDGLVLTPIADEHDGLRLLVVSIDSLPGMRMTLTAGAVRELAFSLNQILNQILKSP